MLLMGKMTLKSSKICDVEADFPVAIPWNFQSQSKNKQKMAINYAETQNVLKFF